MTSARTDQHGNPIEADAAATAVYDRAIDAYLRFSPEVVDAAVELVGQHAEVPMGQALMGYLQLSSTDAPDVAGARRAVDAIDPARCGPRELAHRDAVATWVAGDWYGAIERLDGILQQWPTDVLALLLAHQLDFFVGDAANLGARPTRALAAIAADHPHRPFLQGMQAFGYEEAGRYDEAEAASRAAVDAHPDDVWAIHAVTHVFEMNGRVAEGIGFLEGRVDDWGDGNLFAVHNWWHLALFLLEAGLIDDVLSIYDRSIHHEGSDGVPLEMLDASALLWRLHLDGHDTGGRFGPLADAWATRLGQPSWYVFNDLHLVLALLGADRIAEADGHIADLAAYVAAGGAGANVTMAGQVGLPACRAVRAFTAGDHEAVIEQLLPIRGTFRTFGGSHAQRDLLQRTLLESTLRAGRHDLAATLLDERLADRPASAYAWAQRARLLGATGSEGAEAATAESERLEHAAAAAHVPS